MIRGQSIVLGTRSPGKLRELGPIFAAAGLRVIGLDELGVGHDPEEDAVEKHDTFEENALAKAAWYHRRTGMPAVADDSGLAVDALNGAPGVHSKRWSASTGLTGLALDEANNRKLVDALRNLSERRARYVCAAAFVHGDVRLVSRGETRGRIVLEPRGTNGFGYDPYFESSELGSTFGEASIEAKERISHRGRAFRALIEQLLGANVVGGVANRAGTD